jgi:hypothetical protein
MLSKITQALNYLSRNPFEAGELVEVREETEYVGQSPLQAIDVKTPYLPPELIGEILARVEDPCKIVKLMEVNNTWYQEGRRLLFKNKDKIMEEFILTSINKLEPFMIFLNLDRLDELKKIQRELNYQYKELNKQYEEAISEHLEAFLNLQRYLRANGLKNEWEMDFGRLNLLSDEEENEEGINLISDEDTILPIEPKYYNETHEELSKLWEEKTNKHNIINDSLDKIKLQKVAFDKYIIMKVLKDFV